MSNGRSILTIELNQNVLSAEVSKWLSKWVVEPSHMLKSQRLKTNDAFLKFSILKHIAHPLEPPLHPISQPSGITSTEEACVLPSSLGAIWRWLLLPPWDFLSL